MTIRWKLFLLIGALVAVVTLAFSWAAYREMRSSALAATSARLDGIATQWARVFEAGTLRRLTALRAARDSRAVRDALSRPDSRARAAAAALLGSLLPPTQPSVIQILNADRGVILSVGVTATWANPAASRALLDTAAVRDAGIVGAMRAVGDSIVSTSAVSIAIDGTLRGYLVQTIQLHVDPSPAEVNLLFGGASTDVLLMNRDGSLWTDLAKPIPAPTPDPPRPGSLVSYTSPGAGPVFAAVRPVPGTPWMIVLQTAQDEVLAQTRRFRTRLLIQGALAIGLGMVVAIGLSGSLTRPLARLTAAAETVAAGDYSRPTGLSHRGDELGRLAQVFDKMVSRVHESFVARVAAEEYYRRLFESVPLPLWVYDVETLRILAVNDAAIRHYGYSRDEFLAITLADMRPPEDAPGLREVNRQIDGPPDPGGESWHRKKNGTLVEVETYGHSIEFQGRSARIVVIHDVTERKRSQDVIRRLGERYRRLIEESSDGVTISSLDGRFLAVNPAFVRILGYRSEAEVLALNAAAIYADPDERAALLERITTGGEVRRKEVQVKRKDGTAITLQLTARVVTDPDTGDRYVESVSEDVTELRRMERQFHQAQKMDAVGQLAGGVAHDFNNLLTIILSYSDMLLTDRPPDSPDRADLEAIRQAGESAAALTRQLLIFSRQQVVQPEVMRLNQVIAATGKMLQRLIGEHVELATALDPDAGAVRVDGGQLEQVIVNLAVNARDAMPNGGRLLIESKNVEFAEPVSERNTLYPAGRYVSLVVSDNGTGMDSATQARIFEPFFTTKGPGKGTGLGLATVYGIVKQSGGHISVYSEPGNGTSFKIYLPRVAEPAEPTREPATRATPRGSETVLLVEDEAAVRTIVCQMLERQGYHVLSVPDGDNALQVTSTYSGPIHLLLTDVVMPRMSGRVLAERFATLRPSARILFVSGYTDDAMVHHGVLQSGMQFLEKPFTPGALARKVRLVLDSSPAIPPADPV